MNIDPGDSITGFISKALPWIGAIATGNIPGLIGLAADKIGSTIGAQVPATVDGITQAIAGVKDPEVMLKLKTVDAELQEHLQKMGFENVEALASLAQQDRISARDRDVKIIQATGRNWRADVLAYLAIIAMIAAAYVLVRTVVPVENRDMFNMLLGALVMIIKDIYGFEFSTTRDSQTKTAAIANMANSAIGSGS